MLRSLETRLAKLEAARKPSDARFFMLWARDEQDGERALANAVAVGKVGRGDIVVRACWPSSEGIPASRWVSDHGLSREEGKALDVVVTAEARELGIDMNAPIDWSTPLDDRVRNMSDEQLLAALLGGRVTPRR